jgi:hypothetical protein
MTTTQPSPGPVTAAATGHVGLNVTDVTRSIHFYQQVFGFDLLGETAATPSSAVAINSYSRCGSRVVMASPPIGPDCTICRSTCPRWTTSKLL